MYRYVKLSVLILRQLFNDAYDFLLSMAPLQRTRFRLATVSLLLAPWLRPHQVWFTQFCRYAPPPHYPRSLSTTVLLRPYNAYRHVSHVSKWQQRASFLLRHDSRSGCKPKQPLRLMTFNIAEELLRGILVLFRNETKARGIIRILCMCLCV
jgi:hypothetical protein